MTGFDRYSSFNLRKSSRSKTVLSRREVFAPVINSRSSSVIIEVQTFTGLSFLVFRQNAPRAERHGRLYRTPPYIVCIISMELQVKRFLRAPANLRAKQPSSSPRGRMEG